MKKKKLWITRGDNHKQNGISLSWTPPGRTLFVWNRPRLVLFTNVFSYEMEQRSVGVTKQPTIDLHLHFFYFKKKKTKKKKKLCLEYIFYFFYFFLQLYCPNRISPTANSSCLPWGKPAATESCYPTYGACWVFQCFHNPPNSDMDYGIFIVRTDINAYDCTRGFTDIVRESAPKVDSRRKILCRTGGFEPASAACRSDALPTELHPHDEYGMDFSVTNIFILLVVKHSRNEKVGAVHFHRPWLMFQGNRRTENKESDNFLFFFPLWIRSYERLLFLLRLEVDMLAVAAVVVATAAAVVTKSLWFAQLFWHPRQVQGVS